MKKGTYEMVWFNCRNGERTVQEISIDSTSFTIPDKPDENDWVIALHYKG